MDKTSIMEGHGEAANASNTVKNAVAAIRKAISELQGQIDRVENEERKIKNRIEELNNQPLLHEDIKAVLCAEVDNRAAAFRNGEKSPFRTYARILRPARDPGQHDVNKRLPLTFSEAEDILSGKRTINEIEYGGSSGSRLVFCVSDIHQFEGMLCCFFGDFIKQKIQEEFDQFVPPYPPDIAKNVGPNLAERRTELETLNIQLNALRERRQDLKKQLAELNP